MKPSHCSKLIHKYIILNLVSLLAILTPSIMEAQPISKIQARATMYHIYSLDAMQLNYLTQAKANMDTTWLFKNPYKKTNRPFTELMDSLEYGSYLQSQIVGNVVTHTLVEHIPFVISAKKIDDDILIYLKNNYTKNGITLPLITNAKVQIGNTVLTYDTSYGAYITSLETLNNKLNKTIAIKYLGKDYLQSLAISPEPKTTRYRGKIPYSSHAFGYSIVDKPIYKLKDTLRFKAYLVDNLTGNPITKGATMFIQDATNNKTIFTKKLKAVSPGAFVMDWVLPDSLLQDRNYTITIGWYKSKNNFVHRETNFKIESYILNKNTLSFKPYKEEYKAGEIIKLIATSTDANGFPLKDVHLQYNIKLRNVLNVRKDTLLLLQKTVDSFKTVDTILPYAKVHEFLLDYKELPPANLLLDISGNLIDAQFEKTAFHFYIKYSANPEETIFFQQQDSLYINYKNLGNEKPKSFVLKTTDYQNKTIDSMVVQTPFKYKLQPNMHNAILIGENNKILSSTPIFYNALTLANTEGTRDSSKIKIQFKYPFADGTFYRIKKGNKLLQSGNAKILSFIMEDNSLEPYSILFSNNTNGTIEDNFQRITFYALQKRVNIFSNIPTDAFPGQTIPIEITATDWYGKPVKNFNIATYGVNSMFGDAISEPFVDIPDSLKLATRSENISGTYPNFATTQLHASNTLHISKEHVVRYNLHKNEYYQLLFPKNGYVHIKNTKQQAMPEICVLASKKGILYTPKYVLLDSNLLSIGQINNVSRYSFAVPKGKHSLAIRVFDRYISVDSINILDYNKHYICVNLDSLVLEVNPSFVHVSDTLSMATPTTLERNKIENSLLLSNALNVDSVLMINNSAYTKKQFKFNANNFNQVNVDGDYFSVIAPINDAMAKISNRTEIYALPTGRIIHFYDYNAKTFNSKPLDAKSRINIPFQEEMMQANNLPYLLQPDTQAFVHAIEQVPVKRNNKKESKKEFLNNYNYNPSLTNVPYASINVMQGSQSIAKNIWIVDRENSENSIYNVLHNNNIQKTVAANNKLDIYVFTTDLQMRVLPNIILPTNSVLYINMDSLRTDTLNETLLNNAIATYNLITRIPTLPFYYKPEESNGLQLEQSTTNNITGNAQLFGTIINDALQPIAETYVLLEQNGKYKQGAITNTKGVFEFLSLLPGSYDIKIYNKNYVLKYYYQVKIGGNKTQYFTSILEDRQGQLPDFESINNSYRLSAFYQTDKSSIVVNVFDYKTKTPIKDAQIQLSKSVSDELITIKDKYTFVHQGDIYNITLSKPGYKIFRLSNIQLSYQSNIVLDVFMQNSIKEKDAEYYSLQNYQEVEIINSHIIGQVLDENNYPLESASIKVLNGTNVTGATKTNNNGDYDIGPIPDGKYNIQVTYVGYKPQLIQNVIVKNAKGVVLNFKMQPMAQTLKSAQVRKRKKNVAENNYGAQTSYEPPAMMESLVGNPNMDVVAMRPGVYQEKKGAGLMLGGARGANTETIIDGIVVAKNLDMMEADMVDEETSSSFRGKALADATIANTMFNNILNAGMGLQMRNNFNDVAYWQPNLLTDANGKAYCTVTLPDNITQWKSFTIGMGKAFQYGQTKQDIKAYKPMQSITYTPEFLRHGDSAYLKSNFKNLLEDTKKVNIFFRLNNQTIKNFTTDLDKQISDSVLINVAKQDSIIYTAGLQYLDKYTDAETKTIPVMQNGITLYNNQTIYAEHDSTYTLYIDKNVRGKIIFNNTIYERILQHIESLKNYEYGCVEQSASKLKALVYEKQISKQLQKKTNANTDIIKVLNKLKDMQNLNGSFGWWRKGSSNLRMTTYVLEAASLANKNGYNNTVADDAAQYLISEIKNKNVAVNLYSLYTLSKLGYMDVSNSLLENVNEIQLPTIDKIYLYKLKQQLGVPIDNADWYSLFLELQNNINIRYCDNFFYDHRAGLFNAYALFEGTPIETEFKQRFRTRLTNGQLEKDLNTFSKAALIEALLADAKKSNGNPVNASIIVNDTLHIKTFPYSMAIGNNTIVQLKHKGAPVWVNTAEAYTIEEPTIQDSIFRIQTKWIQNNATTNTLLRGKSTKLNIEIEAYRTKDYVMIEVPLPAGVIIKDKSALPNPADYIEYKQDKIIIYKSQIPLGSSNYTIEVEPIHNGSFNIPPATISMMYYPFIFGNNKKTKIPVL